MSNSINTETNVLDTIRNFFGVDISDLINSIDKVSDKQLISFKDLIRTNERKIILPPKQEGEIRPFLTYQVLEDIGILTRVNLQTDLPFSDRNFSQGPMADILKRNLLYCHSLTLFDPLPYIVDYLPYNDTRIQLRNYLLWLNELKPLVDSEVLTFLSGLAYKERASTVITESRILPDEVTEKLRSFILATDYPYSSVLSNHEKVVADSNIDRAQDSMWEMIYASARYPNSLDYYFPRPIYTNVLREYLAYHSRESQQTTKDSLTLQNLMSINVPNLDALSFDDICQIRNNDETFEKWRYDLRQALFYASAHTDALIDPHSEQAVMVHEELRQRGLDLQNTIASYSRLAKTKAGLKGFTIGSLAAVTKSIFVDSDIDEALITPIASAVISWLWPNSQISKKVNSAALQHYVTFKQPENSNK